MMRKLAFVTLVLLWSCHNTGDVKMNVNGSRGQSIIRNNYIDAMNMVSANKIENLQLDVMKISKQVDLWGKQRFLVGVEYKTKDKLIVAIKTIGEQFDYSPLDKMVSSDTDIKFAILENGHISMMIAMMTDGTFCIYNVTIFNDQKPEKMPDDLYIGGKAERIPEIFGPNNYIDKGHGNNWYAYSNDGIYYFGYQVNNGVISRYAFEYDFTK